MAKKTPKTPQTKIIVPSVEIQIIREPMAMVGRLGRHIQHDERSWNFPAPKAKGSLISISHKRLCKPFNQGNVGSCTGNAVTGFLMTEPTHNPGWNFDEKTALAIYTSATHLDRVPGYYPAEDTGSSGLAAMKAAQKMGYVDKYTHCFGIDHALATLMLNSVITGVNWYEGFDTPDANGHVQISGSIRGGHEFSIVGVDVAHKLIECWNSWGTAYGLAGRFFITWADFKRLLAEKGDVTTATIKIAA